jgi:hypothetical protein
VKNYTSKKSDKPGKMDRFLETPTLSKVNPEENLDSHKQEIGSVIRSSPAKTSWVRWLYQTLLLNI